MLRRVEPELPFMECREFHGLSVDKMCTNFWYHARRSVRGTWEMAPITGTSFSRGSNSKFPNRVFCVHPRDTSVQLSAAIPKKISETRDISKVLQRTRTHPNRVHISRTLDGTPHPPTTRNAKISRDDAGTCRPGAGKKRRLDKLEDS